MQLCHFECKSKNNCSWEIFQRKQNLPVFLNFIGLCKIFQRGSFQSPWSLKGVQKTWHTYFTKFLFLISACIFTRWLFCVFTHNWRQVGKVFEKNHAEELDLLVSRHVIIGQPGLNPSSLQPHMILRLSGCNLTEHCVNIGSAVIEFKKN